MKIVEIGQCFCEEMAKYGKIMKAVPIPTKRELLYEWHPDEATSVESKVKLWITFYISKGRGGWENGLSFWVANADITIPSGPRTENLMIFAGNWPVPDGYPMGYSADPEYIAKAAKSTNFWIDKFISALSEAQAEMPWGKDYKLMGKPLWMWRDGENLKHFPLEPML